MSVVEVNESAIVCKVITGDIIQCRWCGDDFTVTRHQRKYCTGGCRVKFWNHEYYLLDKDRRRVAREEKEEQETMWNIND